MEKVEWIDVFIIVSYRFFSKNRVSVFFYYAEQQGFFDR